MQEIPQKTNPEQQISIEQVPEVRTSQQDKKCALFDDFSEGFDYKWGIVNDGVMGGKSQGSFEISENTLIFLGTINTNGGGFSSLRGELEEGILLDYNSVSLTAKSDGREYKVTFRDSNNSRISHQAIIPFQNTGQLETVTISFSDLKPTFFGQNTQSIPFQKDKAQQIGVILADGVDGEFRLEVEDVKFCR